MFSLLHLASSLSILQNRSHNYSHSFKNAPPILLSSYAMTSLLQLKKCILEVACCAEDHALFESTPIWVALILGLPLTPLEAVIKKRFFDSVRKMGNKFLLHSYCCWCRMWHLYVGRLSFLLRITASKWHRCFCAFIAPQTAQLQKHTTITKSGHNSSLASTYSTLNPKLSF